MSGEPLELVTNQAIFDELGRRFESIIFIGNKDHSDAEDSSTYHYYGNYLTMLGALSRVTYKIQTEMDANGRDGSHDD